MKNIFVDRKIHIFFNGTDIFNVLLKNIKEENVKNIELSIQALN